MIMTSSQFNEWRRNAPSIPPHLYLQGKPSVTITPYKGTTPRKRIIFAKPIGSRNPKDRQYFLVDDSINR